MKNKIIKYLGIDWGGKRIGLAIGDNECEIAIPFKIVAGISEIKKIIIEEEIDEIIIGQPYSMMSKEHKISSEYINFLNSLKKIKIPIQTIDERLTSKAADSLIGTKKSKASRDSIAAMLILQSFLDMHDK